MPSMPDAIVLCGGAGLRLRSVTGAASPKAMARIAGRPFLELLLRQLRRHGFHRAILAVGYQKDAICFYFGERPGGPHVTYSPEASPLGTGGALRNAADLVESDTVLVMNGDSYTNVDLAAFVAAHHQSHSDASLVVVPAEGRDDCGSVLLDERGMVTHFDEKPGTLAAPYANAGIYTVSRDRLCDIPSGCQVSLEREVLPRWIREGKAIRAFVFRGECVDIGTPARYASAQHLLANAEFA